MNIKNILNNQDVNYISAILVSIICALIIHKYINVPKFLGNQISSMIFLSLIIMISKYNIFLGLIITVLFLVINGHSQINHYIERFEDNEEEEEEEQEEQEQEQEESEEAEEEADEESEDNTCKKGHKYSHKTGKKCKKSKKKKNNDDDEDEDVSENFNNGANDNETFQAFKMAKKSLNRQVMKKKKKKSSKD
jgi:flagellar biosynthesis component FlhA